MKRAREPKKKQPQRLAEKQRKAGKRSRYQRCPKCKKLRIKWVRANAHHPGRAQWQKIDNVLVCFLCVKRMEKA